MLVNLHKRYRNNLTCGEKELVVIPSRPSGKLAKSDVHNSLEAPKNN